jgi:hypothetical protein
MHCLAEFGGFIFFLFFDDETWPGWEISAAKIWKFINKNWDFMGACVHYIYIYIIYI